MKYSIERTIIFLPEENTLKLISGLDTELKLSNQANRLLKEFISNKDIILSRDELLKKVWADYGFTASGNSLNVAISELRKAFANMGINPKIITTIHKTGFKFSADIVLLSDTPGVEITEYISEKKSRHRLNILKNKSRLISAMQVSLYFIVAILIYHAIEIIMAIKPPKFEEEKITYIYSFKKCNVFALGVRKLEKDSLAPVLSKENISCDTETDIFFKKTGPKNRVFRADFIGICARNEDNSYASCRSVKKFGNI